MDVQKKLKIAINFYKKQFLPGAMKNIYRGKLHQQYTHKKNVFSQFLYFWKFVSRCFSLVCLSLLWIYFPVCR